VEWDEHGRLTKGTLLRILHALGDAKQPPAAQDAAPLPVSAAPASLNVLALSAASVAALDAATATAAAPESVASSCTGGSRRASLRATLSIDISAVRVSDSSSDGDGADGGDSGSAPGGQQSTSPGRGKAQHASSSSAQQQPQAGCELPQAGGTRSSSSSMSPIAVSGDPSASAGSKKRHCPTPGVALHQLPSIFSGSGNTAAGPPASTAQEQRRHSGRPPSDGNGSDGASSSGSDDEGDDDGSGSDGPLVRFDDSHLPPGSSYKRPATAAGNEQHPAAARAHAEAPWHHKLSERPPTPGIGLGQPFSIFSGSGGSVETRLAAEPVPPQHQRHRRDHAAAAGAEALGSSAGQHLVHFSGQQQASSRHEPKAVQAATQGGHAQQHGWPHNLSQRPPTPGICLGQPVSIFSSSGGQDAAGEVEQHSASEGDDESSDSAGRAVHFKGRPDSASSASAGAGRLTPPHQQQAAKHSRRPPTPGGALGKPVSTIHSSSSDGECAPVAVQEQARHSSRGRASASAVSFQQPGSSSPKDARSTGEGGGQAQHAGASGDGPQWHHKLSERPPTPCVSLGHPVSIFSGSGGSVETGLAAEGSCGHEAHHASNSSCSGSSKQLSADGSRRVSWGERPVVIPSVPTHKQAAVSSPPARGHASQTAVQVRHGGATGSSQNIRPPSAAAAAAAEAASVKQQLVQQQNTPTKSSQPMAKALLARLSPQLAAEVQQQHSRRPLTPGATLGQHNMFADDDDAADGSHADAAAPAAAPRASKVNAGVAADIQLQHWKAKLAQRPPTPGASLGAVSIFADDDDDGGSSKSAAASPSTGRQQLPSAAAGAGPLARAGSGSQPASAASELLSHNAGLALDSWERKLAQRAPTPAASVHHNIFADSERPGAASRDRLQQPVPRDRSPDLVRSGSDSDSSSPLPVDRAGSANPGRRRSSSSRGGSPLRTTTIAADVAASEAERRSSPLRQGNSEDYSDDDGGDDCSSGGGHSGTGGGGGGASGGTSPARVGQLIVHVSPTTASASGSPTHTLSRLQHSASPADRDPSRGSPLRRSSSARPTALE
jgi:hypothetical protein